MWHEWTTQLRGLRLDWGCAAALTLPVMHMPTDEPHKRPASHTFLNTHTHLQTKAHPSECTKSRLCAHAHTNAPTGGLSVQQSSEHWEWGGVWRTALITEGWKEHSRKKQNTHTHTLECELPVCWAAYWTAPLRVRPVRLSWQPEQWEGRGNRGEKKEQKEKVRRRAEE